jgi:hypothetical protein
MALRPVFVAGTPSEPLVHTVDVAFQWHAGRSRDQVRRSIGALHAMAAALGLYNVLEISTYSRDALGSSASAFRMQLSLPDGSLTSVEAVYQGSKVFDTGGPFRDLYGATGREAKTDGRIRDGTNLHGFDFFGQRWTLLPHTAFYDWLYLRALEENPHIAGYLLRFDGFTDIAFNPKTALASQARSAALWVALHRRGYTLPALRDPAKFLGALNASPPARGPFQGDLFGAD